MIALIAALAALTVLLLPSPSHAARPHHPKWASTPEAYTRQLARYWYGWTGAQWEAVEEIVHPESGWDPCSRWPSASECGYTGSNSCGIPQADPCPDRWRGQLASTWRQQCRWLLWYLRGKYGDPLHALSYRHAHGSY